MNSPDSYDDLVLDSAVIEAELVTTTASLVPSQEQELLDSDPQNDPFNPINHLTLHLDKWDSANVAEDFRWKATAAPSYPLTNSQATLCSEDIFWGGSSSPQKLSLGSSPLAVPRNMDQSISNSKTMIGKRKEKERESIREKGRIPSKDREAW